VSFIFGAGIMTVNLFARSIFPTLLQSPINCGAFAMLAGLVIVPVVSAFTRKPDQAMVEEAFSCYDKKTTVPAKEALGD
jgi:Na+(H+)/acetate symporter ActP